MFLKSIIHYVNKMKKMLMIYLIFNKKIIIVYPLHEPWADIGVIKELNKLNKQINENISSNYSKKNSKTKK